MHQNFIRNKRLLIIFKNGEQLIAKHRKTEKGIMYFEDHNPIRLDKMRSAGYYKPQQ